jgi:hypothetical protein
MFKTHQLIVTTRHISTRAPTSLILSSNKTVCHDESWYQLAWIPSMHLICEFVTRGKEKKTKDSASSDDTASRLRVSQRKEKKKKRLRW